MQKIWGKTHLEELCVMPRQYSAVSPYWSRIGGFVKILASNDGGYHVPHEHLWSSGKGCLWRPHEVDQIGGACGIAGIEFLHQAKVYLSRLSNAGLETNCTVSKHLSIQDHYPRVLKICRNNFHNSPGITLPWLRRASLLSTEDTTSSGQTAHQIKIQTG